MNQGMMNTVISAIVGGIVGAGVVFFVSGNKMDMNSLEIEDLRVANLTLTNQAVLLSAEGNPELFIRDGSILAEKVILGNKLVGQQLQAHAMVANRFFATPDNLVHTPMEQWRFFAEIGASTDAGGEIVVRDINGPASVGRPTTTGALLRTGFTPEGFPQMLAIHNVNRSPMEITQNLSERQRQMLNTAAGVMPPTGSFDSGAAAPIHSTPIQGGPAVAQPPGVGTSF